jgi:hypothetical protein
MEMRGVAMTASSMAGSLRNSSRYRRVCI